MALSDEHRQVQDMVRRFADEAIRPDRGHARRGGALPGRDLCRDGRARPVRHRHPERRGGAGMDTLAYAIVMEELARGYASIADQCGLIELIATLLHEHGSDAQRARYLAPMLRAERRPAYAHHRGRGRLGRGRDQDHGGAQRRRLAPLGRQALDPQRPGLRFRGGAGAHRQGRRPSRDEHLHRRSRPPGGRAPAPRRTRWASAPRRSGRSPSTTSRCRRTRCSAPRGAAST